MAVAYLTVEDVRNFVLDRTAQDNELQLDLTFSDEEIMDAMRRSAREFNSIPPLIMMVNPNCLPGDTNVFLYGTAAQLYLSRLSKLSRNDIDYQAGNITTNIVAKQIAHLKALYQMCKEQFVEQSTSIKVYHNVNNCFGPLD